MSAIVVAICGTSGSGKTTLVKNLTKEFEDAIDIYMDDYEVDFNQEPFEFDANYPDLVKWLDEFDFNRISIPNMAEDLKMVKFLREGETYTLQTKYADGQRNIHKSKLIFVEFPFGREIDAFRDIIDIVISIDLPNEISLIRRLQRTVVMAVDERNHEKIRENVKEFTSFLASEINGYELHFWKNFLAVNKAVYKNNDFTVNGLLSINEVTDLSIKFLREHKL